ncbi:copper amine oxidase N-terminal domain-containing protein [Anaerosolibacter sp.]|uniref:copper amine oxidase N-terminal domain-containing protein n=1 Tax=Anaerosolibacter sp. TaxID=1872527 RepID=UPI0039EF9B6F
MRKIIYVSLIISLLILSTTSLTFADSPINIIIDGIPQNYEQEPISINGRTLVPMRAIFETLGCQVVWNGEQQTVSVYNPEVTFCIVLKLGSTHVDKYDVKKVNGQYEFTHTGGLELDVTPQAFEGKTFVPVRFVSEAFGAKVDWDSKTSTIKITTNAAVANNAISQSNNLNANIPIDTNGKEIHISDIVSFGGFTGQVLEIKGSKILVLWDSYDYWMNKDTYSYWAMLAGVNFDSQQWFDSTVVTIQSSGY